MTSSDLVALYLDHVALYDDAGPTIRSVLEINPDAYEIAAALDEERTAGNVRGPLHGVPVLVKDNIRHGGRDADGRGLAGARGVLRAA